MLTGREALYLENTARVAATPALKAEALAALPALRAHAKPCGAKAVIAALAPLVSLYGVSDRSKAEWETYWRFYTEALAGLPLEAIKRGVKEAVEAPDANFFPRPGPLKALCERHAWPVQSALHRASVAARVRPLKEREQPDDGSYRDELIRLMGQVRKDEGL